MSDRSLGPQAATARGSQIAMVTLPAEIDVGNDGQVCAALTSALHGEATVLIADASGTTYCGWAGVRALIRAHNWAAATGTPLRVAASSPVRRILEVTGIDHLLRTYPSLAAALDGEQHPGVPDDGAR
jgi:anti-anti-sigma factor